MSIVIATFFISLLVIGAILAKGLLSIRDYSSTVGANALQHAVPDGAYVFGPLVRKTKIVPFSIKVARGTRYTFLWLQHEAITAFRNKKAWFFAKLHEGTRRLHEGSSNKEKGSASFFLKDIAEHKQKIISARSESEE